MKLKIGAIILGLGAVTSLVLWLRSSPDLGARMPKEDQALAAQVAGLRAEVVNLSHKRARTVVVHENAPETREQAPTPSATTQETLEQKAQKMEMQNQAVAEALDGRLVRESPDPAWSMETATGIRDALAAHLPKAEIMDSDCRATVCRVVLRHDSRDEQHKIEGGALGSVPPFDQGTFYRYDTTSALPKTTMYVIRSGQNIGALMRGETAQLAP